MMASMWSHVATGFGSPGFGPGSELNPPPPPRLLLDPPVKTCAAALPALIVQLLSVTLQTVLVLQPLSATLAFSFVW